MRRDQDRPDRCPAPPAGSEEDRRERLGEKLRTSFDDVLAEPLPDEFIELLRRLS